MLSKIGCKLFYQIIMQIILQMLNANDENYKLLTEKFSKLQIIYHFLSFLMKSVKKYLDFIQNINVNDENIINWCSIRIMTGN